MFERIKACVDGYAPIVLPATYQVTDQDGNIKSAGHEHSTQADARASLQERVWNLVWRRRVVYFATVFVTAFLVFMPVILARWPQLGYGQASPVESLIPIIVAAGEVLPNFLKPWIDAYKAAPEYFLAGVILVGVLLWRGGKLEGRIDDAMRPIWHENLKQPPHPVPAVPPPNDWIYSLRMWNGYRAFFYFLTHTALPGLCACLIFGFLVFCFLVVSSRVFFPTGSLFGGVCVPSRNATQVLGAIDAPKDFPTNALCHATELAVTKGNTYRITLEVKTPWQDRKNTPRRPNRAVATDPRGFGSDKAARGMWLGLPFRRFASVEWFRPIVRVKRWGLDEQVLAFEPVDTCDCPKPDPSVFRATFKVGSTGEVFLYVNDVVFGLPWIAGTRYRDNKGTAKVTIEPWLEGTPAIPRNVGAK